jgi:hypothetical protein
VNLGSMGTPSTNYYPTGGQATQRPPAAGAAANITAGGQASQSASGNISLALNPGIWLGVMLGVVFLIMHKGGIEV